MGKTKDTLGNLPDHYKNKELPIDHVSIYSCVLRDKNLSPKAKALHAYLRTFESEFKLHATWLAENFGVSRPTMGKLLRELLEQGYIDR